MNSDELPISDEAAPNETGAVLPELKLPNPQQPTEQQPSEQRLADLTQQEQALQQEIEGLVATRDDLQAQVSEMQNALGRVVQQNLSELEQRRQTLQLSIEQLERRQERIRNEMKSSFAGASQEIAIRVQSFKDYLVGSLQDLAIAAEQLELPTFQAEMPPVATPEPAKLQATPSPNFGESAFEEEAQKIRSILDQFRNQPDYYGPVWKLRRTFEPVHAERVSNWFFKQGGRGAVRTMGSRLQNILIASAATSILYNLYRDRLRVLILANSPERLGEWRRGLQDCLGVTRSDFGSDRGIALFEAPEQLALRAERCDKDGLLPLIVVDESEESINLALLQFPLLLAFAPSPQQMIQQQSYY
ncbi:DUF3086 domain-containing protein [Cyanobacteria bacterium FACHB-DQ100]|nr:DUF3086 domain-containing protein [Cyanobacteria bacterium FACHB-DQ100]